MATPKVFISSTCYDLKYIRENLLYFIEKIGFEAILSEEGKVFFNPSIHVHDSCIKEIYNCQIFVLIIGGRFGSNFKNSDYSITNAEYKEAINNKIPIFTLVEDAVLNQSFVYEENKLNEDIDETKIKYPAVDNTKIFEFMNEVRNNSYNNSIVPFKNFNDIEMFLKHQWAGMLFSFLMEKNREKKAEEQFNYLKDISNKIEMMSNQILKSVGTPKAKLIKILYEIIESEKKLLQMRNKSFIEFKGNEDELYEILKNEKYLEYIKPMYKNIIILENIENDEYEEDDGSITISKVNEMGLTIKKSYLEEKEDLYKKIREKLINKISEHNWKIEDVIEGE